MITPRSHLSRRPFRAATRGFSLVEVMISLVIGLVVVGAVFTNYLTTVRGERAGSAIGQMTEDAGVAFSVMRRHIAMAGFSYPTGYSAGGLAKVYSGPAIFGCNSAFTLVSAEMSSLDCSSRESGTPPANSIAVAYQADDTNAVDSAQNGAPCGVKKPYDVAGGAIECTSGYFLSLARFYVNDGKLMARGTNTSNALVENIVGMRIWYGVSSNTAGGSPQPTPVKYVDADAVGTTPSAASWRNVRAVRICLVVKSEAQILDEVTPYYGCDAINDDDAPQTTPGDRSLYRAFTSTIMVQNL